MKIKIEPKNEEKIEKELEKVNGRARSFAITRYRTLELLIQRVEDRLAIIPKKDQIGISVFYRKEGPYTVKYKYAAKSTGITIQRFSTGWFLTQVIKSYVHPKEPEILNFIVGQKHADIIIERTLRNFLIVG